MIVALVRALMVKATGTAPLTTGLGGIAGKAVLIADMLPWINRYPEEPLIYNVAWKTLMYTLVSAVIHISSTSNDFAREAGGIAVGNEKLLRAIIWPHFWAIEIILFDADSPLLQGRELVRVIGRERCLRAFLGRFRSPSIRLESRAGLQHFAAICAFQLAERGFAAGRWEADPIEIPFGRRHAPSTA